MPKKSKEIIRTKKELIEAVSDFKNPVLKVYYNGYRTVWEVEGFHGSKLVRLEGCRMLSLAPNKIPYRYDDYGNTTIDYFLDRQQIDYKAARKKKHKKYVRWLGEIFGNNFGVRQERF